MNKIYFTSLSVILLLLCQSCDMFDYHPYSVRLDGRNDINTTTIEQLEMSGLTTPFKFAFITDTQGALDETLDAIDIIKSRGDIDFIIHGGDITDFGMPKEFIWGRDALESSGLPFLSVIGNHDCLGNGEDTFAWMFGPENFSFNIGCVHFVGLNTVALEYDYSHPVPDFDFIESDYEAVSKINEATPDSITHTIMVMHSRPYDEQFNNNVAKPFNHYIKLFPGMTPDDKSDGEKLKGFCVNGHNHYTEEKDIFGDSIIFYQCANMAKRCFFVFNITEDGYDYEKVEF